MRNVSLLFLLFSTSFCATSSFADDDAEHNRVAKTIKSKILKKIKNYRGPGYCDLMIEMSHDEKFATIRKISYTGDHSVCKESKKAIKRKQRFRYQIPEKFIRLHISAR